MNYRPRIWEKYASTVQKHAEPLPLAFADHWGQAYDTYLEGWLPTDRDAPMLDAGCGYGLLLRYLTKRGYTNVQGIDISPEQVALARAVHARVEQADTLEYLARRTGQFAVIAALDLIEHLTKDEALRFLDGCHAALRPGGILLIQTVNADAPWGLSIRYGDFTHEIAFNPHCLEWVTSLCGFTAFQARELGPIPRGPASIGRWVLWKLIRLQWRLHNLVETGAVGSGILTRCFIARCLRP